MKMKLKGTGWEDVEWIHLAPNRNHWQTVMKTVMNLQVP
jgi:hypothetical protein